MGKKFTPVPEQTALAHALIILNSTRPYSDIILVLSELINPSGSSLNFNCLLKSQTPMKVFWINEPLMQSSDITTPKIR